MSRMRIRLRVAGALILTVLCSGAHADVYVRALAGNTQDLSYVLAPVAASERRENSAYGEQSTVAARAEVDPLSRSMHLDTTAAVTDYTCTYGANCDAGYSIAAGLIHDEVLAHSIQAGGDRITLVFNPIQFDGNVQVSGVSGFQAMAVQFNLSATGCVDGKPDCGVDNISPTYSFSLASQTFLDVASQTHGFQVTVDNGATVNMIWQWAMSSFLTQGPATQGVAAHASGSYSADFSRTALWGGLAGAYDARTHAPLNDMILDSELGFDWSRAGVETVVSSVPEPETYGLLVAGLFVIGWNRRSRQAVISSRPQ